MGRASITFRATCAHRCKFAVTPDGWATAGRNGPFGRRTGKPVETAEHPTFQTRSPQQWVLDRYRLIRRLGAGGFGVVWLAHDEHLDRAVAVKRVPIHGSDPERAEREAVATARLQHPGIVALYEAGRDDDAVYLVSELVRGRTFGELARGGELSDRDVLAIGIALCDGLGHAHKRGVVHRDVKPSNVLVPDMVHEGAGIAKLTDFGVARMLGDDALTRTGDVVGTLAYMAPEQAEGRTATEASDLYSLALVLYEGLAGSNPVRGRGAASTARRLGARMPPLQRVRRDLPHDLCQAIDSALLPRPEQRGDLRRLRQALVAALEDVSDERGTIATPRGGDAPSISLPHVGSGIARVPRPRRPAPPAGAVARAAAATAAAGLTYAAVTSLGVHCAVRPAVAAGAAGLAVALVPRLGWLLGALALFLWLAGPAPGIAVLVACVVVPTLILLRRAPGAPLWIPALAPLLGAVGLAGIYPALAGQARHWSHRAALGALGLWWLVLAELLTGDKLLLGVPPGARPSSAWRASAPDAWHHALAPLASSGVLALAAVWAAFAALLPMLVRGRSLGSDVVLATMWAAGLAGATQAIARTVSGVPDPYGLVAGGLGAGLIALLCAASRGVAVTPARA
jgi:eukaryotic-like serine/threonine-protein kinase